MNVVQMSLTAGTLIVIIIALRIVAINKFRKKMFVILWQIVLLRLLLPIKIPMKFSIASLIAMLVDKKEVLNSSQDILNTAITRSTTGSQAFGITTNYEQTEIPFLLIIWLVGVVLLLTISLTMYIKEYKTMQESLPVNDDSFINQWLLRNSKKRNIKILVSDRITTPITYGIITPRIVLPKTMNKINSSQFECAMTHELVHIKCLDNMWKIMSVIALCIHWFNPLVWMMYLLFNRDIELSCDEKVISILGENEKQAYALALISLAEQKREIHVLYNGFGKNAIKERIAAVMKYKRQTIVGLGFSLIFILTAVNVFAVANTHKNSRNDIISNNTESPDISYKTVKEEEAKEKTEKQIVDIEKRQEKVTTKDFGISDMIMSVIVPMIVHSDQFSEYQKLGLSYDEEKDKLIYKKQVVGYFRDNPKKGVNYRITDPTGTIGIKAIRDKNKKLTGFKEVDLDAIFNPHS